MSASAMRGDSAKIPSRSSGVSGWLALAAAPTFVAMALLTAASEHIGMCAAMAQGWSLGGMASMYLLMAVFHLPPWLKLASGRLGRGEQAGVR